MNPRRTSILIASCGALVAGGALLFYVFASTAAQVKLNSGSLTSLSSEPSTKWLPFELEEVNRHLKTDEIVILFGNPLYHIEGPLWDRYFQETAVQDVFSRVSPALFRIEYRGWHEPDVADLFSLTVNVKEPIVAVFVNGSGPRYFNYGDREKLIDLLVETSKIGETELEQGAIPK